MSATVFRLALTGGGRGRREGDHISNGPPRMDRGGYMNSWGVSCRLKQPGGGGGAGVVGEVRLVVAVVVAVVTAAADGGDGDGVAVFDAAADLAFLGLGEGRSAAPVPATTRSDSYSTVVAAAAAATDDDHSGYGVQRTTIEVGRQKRRACRHDTHPQPTAVGTLEEPGVRDDVLP